MTGIIVDAAFRLHARPGPGLLENVYETLLAEMLRERGLRVQRQKSVGFVIDDVRFTDGLRIDLPVQDRVVVELKAIERRAPVHSRQPLTDLRLMKLKVGLLINVGEARLKDGLHRMVNQDRPAAQT